MISIYLPYLPRKLFIFGTFVFFLFVFSTIQIKQNANEVSTRRCMSGSQIFMRPHSSLEGRSLKPGFNKDGREQNVLSLNGAYSSSFTSLEPIGLPRFELIEERELTLKDHITGKASVVIESVSSGYYKVFNIDFTRPCKLGKSFLRSSKDGS